MSSLPISTEVSLVVRIDWAAPRRSTRLRSEKSRVLTGNSSYRVPNSSFRRKRHTAEIASMVTPSIFSNSLRR